jgi:uncharacterized membrane protein
MFCSNCGADVAPDLQFCPSCGQPQPVAIGPAPPPIPIQPPVVYTPPFEVRVETGRWLGAGWQIVQQNLGAYALMALLFGVLASCVPVVLHGPLMVGFHIAFMRKMVRGIVEVGDLFKGFSFFVPSLIASILISIFTTIGFLCCIIPGIVVSAMFMFTYLFIVDKRMDFWPAMQSSHEIVKKNYVGFSLFILATILLNLAGALCLLVGLLITVPITFAAITVAYQEIVGFDPNTV